MRFSDAAGVCDYLDTELAGVPYVKLEMANFYGAVAQIEEILRDYVRYRSRLLERLIELKLPTPAPDLHPVYEAALAHSRMAESSTYRRSSIYFTARGASSRDLMLAVARSVLPHKTRQSLKRLVRMPKSALSGVLTRLSLFTDSRLAWHAFSSTNLKSKFWNINLYPESNLDSLGEKVRVIHGLTSGPTPTAHSW